MAIKPKTQAGRGGCEVATGGSDRACDPVDWRDRGHLLPLAHGVGTLPSRLQPSSQHNFCRVDLLCSSLWQMRVS